MTSWHASLTNEVYSMTSVASVGTGGAVSLQESTPKNDTGGYTHYASGRRASGR
jgi:hypothetical protein